MDLSTSIVKTSKRISKAGPKPLPAGQSRHAWPACALLCALTLQAGDARPETSTIAEVALDRTAFNPSAGEHVTLSFRLAPAGGPAEVLIYDPDGGLIRRLDSSTDTTTGAANVTWDGRDDSGAIVPDEAYGFVIEAASGAVYDPLTFSGGEVADITEASIDAIGNIAYTLPAPARVLIRLGVHDGPMYRTLVDWRPRPAGSLVESWDGFDEQGLLRVRDHPDFKVLLTYATLPETTVITHGNQVKTYRDDKLGAGQDRPQRPARPRDEQAPNSFRPTSLVPPAWSRAPQLIMRFPAAPDPAAVPKVKDSVTMTIDVSEADRAGLAEDQHEVIFYVDGLFSAEAERGYLPLTWDWELTQHQPGERILTANVVSFRGQVGVVSRKVLLAR
jgi:hypothetical protein